MDTKLTYLIMAHEQPELLSRLVGALAHEDAHFYIHIDAKADIGPFAALGREKNVTLLPRRLRVSWGGYNSMCVQLALIRAAMGSPERFARYTLLSGSDFPIQPRDALMKELLRTDREFLHVGERLTGPARCEHFGMVRRRFCGDNPFAKRGRVVDRCMNALLWCAFGAANSYLSERRFVKGLTPYWGSAWWSLTGSCIRYVLGFLDRRPDYARFFRFSFIPDEIFFQTILMASPYADRISHDLSRQTSERDHRIAPDNVYGCHYVDWSIHAAHPKVLGESDLPALLSSTALFARKFDAIKSSTVLTALESRE